MSYAACYVIDVACDDKRHELGWPNRAQFTGRTEPQTIRAGRDAGWQFRKWGDGMHIRCPLCIEKFGARLPANPQNSAGGV